MADDDSGLKNYNTEELQAEVERLRAEKALLQAELDKQKQGVSRGPLIGRGTLTWILVLLTFLAAVLAPIAVWARRSILDTDTFANKVGPLVGDETVARSLSAEVANRLFVRLEMQKRVKEALQEAFPDRLNFLAGPVSDSLQTLTQKIAHEVLTSPQFQAVWEKVLRLAHSTAVGIIRGDRALTISTSGEVVFDGGELMENVRGRLVGAGLGFLEKAPIPPDAGEVVLFTSAQLGDVKSRLEVLDSLGRLLPLVFFVLFVASLLVSEDRRGTLMWLSVALAAAMVLSLMLLNLAQGELLGVVRNPDNLGAVRVIWDRLTADLVRVNVAVLILGIVGTFGFALAGPYAWAVRARHKAVQVLAPKLKRRIAE